MIMPPAPRNPECVVGYRIERTRNRHSRAVLEQNTVVIRLARRLTPYEERHHIENLLRRMQKMVLSERSRIAVDPYQPLLPGQKQETEALVHRINDRTLRVPIGRVRLRAMTTQWGSC